MKIQDKLIIDLHRSIDEKKLSKVIEILKDHRLNTSLDYGDSIKIAVHNDSPQILKILLEDHRLDPINNEYSALRCAIDLGIHDCLELLKSNTTVYNSLKNKKDQLSKELYKKIYRKDRIEKYLLSNQ